MSLSKHINHLIQASALTKAEDQKLKTKHGIDTTLGINPFDPKVVEWVFADRPQQKKIEAYLNNLSYDTLLKIEALMYFGRDGGDLQDLYRYFSERYDDKHDIIRTIVEKDLAYPFYFKEAVSHLKKQGIDIDSASPYKQPGDKIIKKFGRKADKELEKRDKLITEESDLLLDTSKGPITRRELVEELEPKSKQLRRQKKRSANAELNLQRATKKTKSTK